MNRTKWMLVLLAFGGLMLAGCTDSDLGESTTLLTNAHVSQTDDSFVVTGLVNGVEMSLEASEVGFDALRPISAVRCFLCVCDDTACACQQVPCPVLQ